MKRKILSILLVVAVVMSVFSTVVPVSAALSSVGTISIQAYSGTMNAVDASLMSEADLNALPVGTIFTARISVSMLQQIKLFGYYLTYSKDTLEVAYDMNGTTKTYVNHFVDKITNMGPYTKADLDVVDEDVGTLTSTTGNIVNIVKRTAMGTTGVYVDYPSGTEMTRIEFRKIANGPMYIKAQPSKPSIAAGKKTGFQFTGRDTPSYINASIAQEIIANPPVSADKTNLNNAIAAANTAKNATSVGDKVGNVSQSAMDTFTSAITAAQTVSDNGTATQGDVDTATTTLNNAKTAFDAAKIPAPNKDALGAAIAAAIADKNATTIGDKVGNVAQGAFDTFAAAIAAASAVNADNTIAQAGVDTATSTLNNAKGTFDSSKIAAADKAALNAAIAAAKSNKDAAAVGDKVGNVAQGAMDTFIAAIAAAQAVSDDATLAQPAVDSAKDTLNLAVAAFDGAKIAAADKAALSAAIVAAKADRDQTTVGTGVGDVSDTAKSTFNDAIAAAEAVLADGTLAQSAVDSAKDVLLLARAEFDNSKRSTAVLSGSVSLPNGDLAPTGGILMVISAKSEGFFKSINKQILKGRNSVNYAMDLPTGTYELSYYLVTVTGKYLASGTIGTYDVSDSVSNANATLAVAGGLISGTISLPAGQVAPAGGISIVVGSRGTSAVSANITIAAGTSSVNYKLSVKSGSASVYYYIHGNNDGYMLSGDIGNYTVSGDITNANATLVKSTGSIRGTISLPNGQVAPAGGLSLVVVAGIGSERRSQNITIKEGQNSVDYFLNVSAGLNFMYVYFTKPNATYKNTYMPNVMVTGAMVNNATIELK